MVPSDHDATVLLHVVVSAALATGTYKGNILSEVEALVLTVTADTCQMFEGTELWTTTHVDINP